MKVLGKVWKNEFGGTLTLTLEFYIEQKGRKGWWKVNPIQLSFSNKRFNLHRLFLMFATRLEYPFSEFAKKRQGGKLMWEREIEVEEGVIKKKFSKAVES
jgi:hypothetical protein